MIYGEIPGIGRPLSRVVLGAGSLDEPRYDDAAALFDAYLATGGTAIDTAAVYGDGASERVVGQWLRRSGCRDEVVIVTKGGHPDLTNWQPRLTPEDVEQDLTESLDRLGVDCVDLYLLHRDNEEIPVDELVDMLASHAGAGRVKAVGVSNWTWQRAEEANQYTAESGAPRIAANSVHYSLATPKVVIAPGAVTLCDDPTAVAWYGQSGLPVLAWSSQAKGFFSGRFAPTVHDRRARRADVLPRRQLAAPGAGQPVGPGPRLAGVAGCAGVVVQPVVGHVRRGWPHQVAAPE